MDSKIKDIRYPVGVYVYDESSEQVCIVISRGNRGMSVRPLPKLSSKSSAKDYPDLKYVSYNFAKRNFRPMVVQIGDKLEILSLIHVVEELVLNHKGSLVVTLKNPLNEVVYRYYDKVVKDKNLII